ncbi:MAG: Lrp/AsnC family transcriptional regulator [bacterium]
MKKDHDELDELDLKIIRELQRDGRASSKEIAGKLGVSDGTIRFRANRLQERNILRITGAVNPFASGTDGIIAMVGMELEKRTHTATMKKISRLKGVLSVCNVTGRYDLLVEIYLESRQELNRFLLEGLSKVGGINRTETFIVLDAISKWVELP